MPHQNTPKPLESQIQPLRYDHRMKPRQIRNERARFGREKTWEKSVNVIGSKLWFEELFKSLMGFEARDFQTASYLDYRMGRDTLVVVATGSGKSAICQSIIYAERVRGNPIKILLVEPTKALSDDQVRVYSAFAMTTHLFQVREAKLRGIKAIALHEDAVTEADHQGINLFTTCIGPEAELIVVTPETLQGDRFQRVLDHATFRNKLAGISVDEMHLVDEWGRNWRPTYLNVSNLRQRLSSDVWWLGTSASCPQYSTLPRVEQLLGFERGQYSLHRNPVDRLDISYHPRFLKHTYTGTEFLDLAWIVPEDVKGPEDIRKTVIYCETIQLADAVSTYLESLLLTNFPNRAQTIKPFHSILSHASRHEILQELDDSSVLRIIVATDCAAQGLNVRGIQDVVCFSLCKTVNHMLQWAGRAGRGQRCNPRVITYAPPWMQVPKTGIGTTQKAELEGARRSKQEPTMLDWFNRGVLGCPRQVACRHNGDSFKQPDNCCNYHNPDDANVRYSAIKAADKKAGRKAAQTTIRSDKTYEPLTKKMKESARYLLTEWRQECWRKIRGNDEFWSAEIFLPTGLINTLAERLYAITSEEKLHILLKGRWDED